MPDGYGGVIIKSDSTKAFADEMDQLLKTKVALEATPLKLEMLDKLKLTPNQLLKMEEFIEM